MSRGCDISDTGLKDTGGSFSVDESQELVILLLEGSLHLIRIKNLTPWPFEAIHLSSVTACNFIQSFTKIAHNGDQHMISRFDEIA